MLIALGALSEHEIGDDIILHTLWHIHVLHGGVSQVNRLLELSVLQIQILDDHCYVTEDIGVDDGAQEYGEGAEEDFELSWWQNIITSQKQNSIIHTKPVFVPNGGKLIKTTKFVRTPPDVAIWVYFLYRWSPNLILLNNKEPHTSKAVDIHDQEKYELC